MTFTTDVGQQLGPNGEVTYDFAGHVHAQGLDLDAGTSVTAPDDRRVRWIRSSDGAVIAQLLGYTAFGTSAGWRALAGGALLAVTDGIGGPTVAGGDAAAPSTFIDGAGRSSFVKREGGPGDTAITWNAGNGTLDVYETGALVAQITP